MNQNGPWAGLPGADLVEQGLADLAAERISEHALLILVGEPRLRRLDIALPKYRPALKGSAEHALYELLEEKGGDAYSRYNSLLRRLNSFAHALEWEQSKTHQT